MLTSTIDPLRYALFITWEEMPIQHRGTVEWADELLRKITSVDKPSGGKILAVGDFRKTAPVVPRARKSDTIAAPIRSSHLWPAFHILRLYAPIRNAEDIQYAEFVDPVGDGKLGHDSHWVRHSVLLHMIQEIDSIESTIQYLHPSV